MSMKITTITSSSNALLKKIRGLQERAGRDKTGQFVLEGLRPVEEAVARHLVLDRVVVSESYFQTSTDVISQLNLYEISVVDDRTFKELHGTSTSCGIIAIATIPQFEPDDIFDKSPAIVVICDEIQDPGNLGTIVRSAYASDVAGLILTRGCADPYGPKVVRATAGSLFDIPLIRDTTHGQCLEMLAQRNIPLWICDASASILYFEADLRGPLALVFGNETRGISDEFLQNCAGSLCIPMRQGSESLNVGVSAGIILSESFRQRLTAHPRG